MASEGERRGAPSVLVRKAEGKRPFGRRKCKWGDSIKMDLLEILWGEGCGLDQFG